MAGEGDLADIADDALKYETYEQVCAVLLWRALAAVCSALGSLALFLLSFSVGSSLCQSTLTGPPCRALTSRRTVS